MTDVKIEVVSLDGIRAADGHARRELQASETDYLKLRRSMETYGCVELLIWNRRTGSLVSGHQRLNVLRAAGTAQAPCVIVDLDEDNEKALGLAMNRIGGAWDEEKLRALLESFGAEFDIGLTGFDEEEIRSLLDRGLAAQDDGFDADGALAEITEPITQCGDVWRLGDHRLMCGDACSGTDMDRLMDGAKARLVLTDPPYNVDYRAAAGSIMNDKMADGKFLAFLTDAFSNMARHCEPGTAAYVFHADTKGTAFRKAFGAAGWELHQVLVWVKNHFALGRQDYFWRHEPILYGWLPGAAHYFAAATAHTTAIDDDPPPAFHKMLKRDLLAFVKERFAETADGTVIRCDRPQTSPDHPTMKPVELLGRLIQNSSRPGWPVLDAFGGSGSTLIACEQLGRTAFLMELDPGYCTVIIRRWESLTGRTAEKT